MTAVKAQGTGKGRRIHSRYADGTVVWEGQQPPRLSGPDPAARSMPHSVIRWDRVNGRIYQLREFDAYGHPVRDIDFTNPTSVKGKPYPGHPGPPHQHRWSAVDPNDPKAGFQRGASEPLP